MVSYVVFGSECLNFTLAWANKINLPPVVFSSVSYSLVLEPQSPFVSKINYYYPFISAEYVFQTRDMLASLLAKFQSQSFINITVQNTAWILAYHCWRLKDYYNLLPDHCQEGQVAKQLSALTVRKGLTTTDSINCQREFSNSLQ